MFLCVTAITEHGQPAVRPCFCPRGLSGPLLFNYARFLRPGPSAFLPLLSVDGRTDRRLYVQADQMTRRTHRSFEARNVAAGGQCEKTATFFLRAVRPSVRPWANYFFDRPSFLSSGDRTR